MVKRQKVDFANDPFSKMGGKLRILREQHNMTISQLAETIQVSNKTISNYENGHNRMTIETLIKLYNTRAFGEFELEELLQIFIVDIFIEK